jgi:hypothetical protein
MVGMSDAVNDVVSLPELRQPLPMIDQAGETVV